VALSGHPERVLLVVSVCLVAITLAGLIGFVRRDVWPRGGAGVHDGTVWALVVALLAWTFLSPTYVVWSMVSLMETPLWGLVVTLGTISAARGVGTRSQGWSLAAWVALALLTRPEGMLVALVWIAARGFALWYQSGGWKEALRRSIVPGTVYGITLLGLLAFRLAYFGYPLPNTFYAKVSPSLAYNLRHGLEYLARFVLWQILTIAALGAALAFVVDYLSPAGRRSGADPEDPVRFWRASVFVFSVSLLAGIAAPVLSGGDSFPYFRFFQPFWPMLGVPLVAWLASWVEPRPVGVGRAVHGAGALTCFALGIFLTAYLAIHPRWDRFVLGRPEIGYIGVSYQIAAQNRAVGEDLNRVLGATPAESLGVLAAGGVGVTYRGPIFSTCSV
jgi:hypothetical protein